ncbi:MAG TPA: PPOX class F420-dependent oxidoreductase [Hyphomicrobiaceae bacterium]|nr:PPOX class F420-dependent oxidoreductase [Hyphomicrobiaceae bacterium]
MMWPDSFSESVNFPPHQHFVHDVGAFQFGIGTTLLLAMIWADALTAALAGYLLGAAAHTVTHIVDAQLGGSTMQTLLIGLLALLAAVALVARWRALGCIVGRVDAARTPALEQFTRQKTVVLTTYRRDGTPVATPVSIAVVGQRAYVRSFERAWKTRRIRNNPAVTVAPSTARGKPTGPAINATARRLTGTEYDSAARALARKYPMLHGVLVPLGHRLGRRKSGRTVHFELTPTQATENAADRTSRARSIVM